MRQVLAGAVLAMLLAGGASATAGPAAAPEAPSGCAWREAAAQTRLYCPESQADATLSPVAERISLEPTTLAQAQAGDRQAMTRLGVFYLLVRRPVRDPALAVTWLRKALALGDERAGYGLGMAALYGRGLPASAADAVAFFRRAAAAGDVQAMGMMASLAARGAGMARDPAEAARWTGAGARAGDPVAMARLAIAYERGLGVEKDAAKALAWMRAAADAGNPAAMTNLSIYYAQGVGVAADPAQSLSWLRRAADHGDRRAMLWLADMYAAGSGVAADPAAAADWRARATVAQAAERRESFWKRGVPAPEDFARYYPERAARLEIAGRATLRCIVDTDGRLKDCRVAEEDPADYGFGEAALKLSRLFVRRLDGDEGGEPGEPVDVPLSFDLARS